MARVGAPEAWSRTLGEGVKVAVLDTGIDSHHPDLEDNVRGVYNAKSPGAPGKDDNGHGTHVAGIIAAAKNGLGVVGVAPAAEIYGVKIFNRWGNGHLSDIIAGLNWAYENGIRVVNMSFGTSQPSRALEEAVDRCLGAGMVLVAAAGNQEKDNSVLYSARYPGVIAVSAIDREGKLASFSSRGPEVTLAAPGVDILSTIPGNRYGTKSGTSMACPHVTGIVALLLALRPRLSGHQVAQILPRAAEPLRELTPEEQGAGLAKASFLAKGKKFFM